MSRCAWFLAGGIMVSYAGMAMLADAHGPDGPDLEISEISIEAERPVAASSQQYINDKEYVMQPQGRPAQVLRLIPGLDCVALPPPFEQCAPAAYRRPHGPPASRARRSR